MANLTLPTALVAVDSRTGAIRAVANNPPGFDRALLGQYPPGSTLKIVTAAAGLGGRAARRTTIVPCPYEIQPGDSAPFSNAFGEEYGDIPFIEAFAKSCNTSFVDQGFQLGAGPAAGDGRDLRLQPGLRHRGPGVVPVVPAAGVGHRGRRPPRSARVGCR